MADGALIGTSTATAKALAQLVAARALDEIYLTGGFKDQLGKLNKKFEYIQSFLDDAGSSKYAEKSREVKLWVQKVKDAAYLADDTMDEYSIEIFRRKVALKSQLSVKSQNLFTFSNTVLFRFQMAQKVNEILSLFDEIQKEAKEIGLNQVAIPANFETHSYKYDDYLSQMRQHEIANASEYIHREDEQGKLLDVICSPSNNGHVLSTVAIVGMGGVGKTTLTRHIYHHERTCAKFGDKKIWICVSEDFDITSILNKIIKSVTSTISEMSNTDAIIRKLQQELKGKKILLVLDDVWNDNDNLWVFLKVLLHNIGIVPGSVILITTRNDEVAMAAGAVFQLKLEGLSKYKSWCLFRQFVSNNGTQPMLSTLEEVGKRIVEKCGGIPLAIRLIGSLLQSKHYLSEWEAIEKTELWDLPHIQNQILSSLLLSSNHLPSLSVKQCFAYFAIIPKGQHVFKNELIGLWLSQSYLRNDKRKYMSMEEIGEENLQILLSNSLLEKYVPQGLETVCYKMHDLVYDLAVYICGSDLIKEAKELREAGNCRHLVFNSAENIRKSKLPARKALIKLRTIRFIGSVPWSMLIHMRYLRTMLLDRTGITEIPPAIGLLIHLRFLNLSHNPISTLPSSMGELYQLQTLVLQGCRNLKKLPKVLNKLVNLRNILTTTPMFACKGLQQLTNLQSLPCLSLDDEGEGWSIDELGDLHNLRDEIHLAGLESVKDKEQAIKAGLALKANVTKLTLSWAEVREKNYKDVCDLEVLEGLEPHLDLTSLKVNNFNGEKFPSWISRMAVLTDKQKVKRTQLNNLTMVKLLNCSRCQTLPKLGQLPFLKCLILSGLDVEFIDNEFYGGDDLYTPATISFQCLEELEIFEFRKLTTWMKPPKAAFPRLETLQIRDCSLLKSVPALGIKSLDSLDLKNLGSVESLDILKYNTGITSLVMYMLPKIVSLPQELANCRKLQILHISYFEKLASLPEGLESLVNLQSIRVAHCTAMNFVLDDLVLVRSSLCAFEIVDCPNLKKVPNSLEECTLLETLWILKCPMIERSPKSISKLLRLQKLRISCSSAEHLKSVLEAAQCLPLLRCFEIEGFKDDKDMREYFFDITSFLRLPSLTELMLWGRPNIRTFPQQLGLLTRIQALYIWHFEDLEEIPTWICNLSSLRYLILEKCENLKTLPSKEGLQHIISLRITRSKLLAKKYVRDGGSRWHDISHIGMVEIDGKTIQDLDEELILNNMNFRRMIDEFN